MSKETMAQSTSNITEKFSEELQLSKEKISSLQEQNHQLDLQGGKVINKTFDSNDYWLT